MVAFVLLVVAIPPGFPYGSSRPRRTAKQILSLEVFHQVDLAGFALLLSASLLIIVGFEQAATERQWDLASVIAPLVVSAMLWVAFFAWSRTLSRIDHPQEPVFPWRLVTNREFLGLLL